VAACLPDRSTDVWEPGTATLRHQPLFLACHIAHQIELETDAAASRIRCICCTLPRLSLSAALGTSSNLLDSTPTPPHDDCLRSSFGLDSPAPFHFLISLEPVALHRLDHKSNRRILPARSSGDRPSRLALSCGPRYRYLPGSCTTLGVSGDILNPSHGSRSHHGKRCRGEDVVCKGMWPSIRTRLLPSE
jgi:hypothetical protein